MRVWVRTTSKKAKACRRERRVQAEGGAVLDVMADGIVVTVVELGLGSDGDNSTDVALGDNKLQQILSSVPA
jgi:hypothetical protein